MQILELEAETIQISIYTNIVLNILQKHKELSLNKMIFFSYLIKKENFRPLINDLEQKKEVNYYIGSMARHTLIQLCGYLGFLKILLVENKYPIIPILVIDHVSKPFDVSNARAIGQVINKAYEVIGKENLQVFMFDHKEYETLALQPEHFENLVNDKKSGFNPFYYVVSEKNEKAEE